MMHNSFPEVINPIVKERKRLYKEEKYWKTRNKIIELACE